MTEPMFPVVTHDADRERIRARARLARDVLADLEEAAISAASRHGHQVDALKTQLAAVADERDAAIAEVDRLNNLDVLSLQLPDGSVPVGIEEGLRTWHSAAVESRAVDMAVGLDDIRTILEEEKHAVVQHLLVIEDDKVQVIDSLHQLLAHIIAVDTNWPASEMESLRRQLQFAQDQLARTNHALTDNIRDAKENHDANEAMYAEEIATITGKVRALAEAIRPINTAAAEIAARCDFGAAIDVVAQAVTELAGQIMNGGRGETAKALAMAQAYATQTEDEMHAIEAVCEAGGMPPTIEREDIPAWLAEHLTTRIERKEKAKKAKKAKAPAVEADDDQGQLSILDEVSDA